MTIKSTDQQYTFNFVEAQKDNFPYTVSGYEHDMNQEWSQFSDFKVSISGINEIDYKFNEPALIKEFKEYVDKTYNQRYSKTKFQASEFIYDASHGTGFNMGNVMKYAQRYGNKGTSEDARKDLMKVIHYAFLQMFVHDKSV